MLGLDRVDTKLMFSTLIWLIKTELETKKWKVNS